MAGSDHPKILAAITQLDFEGLYQRHVRRKRLQYTICGVLGFSLAIAFAGLGSVAMWQRGIAINEKKRTLDQEAIAIRERNIAREQRDSAITARNIADEEILNILTDLRSNLEQSSSGFVQQLAQIAETARVYYESLPPAAMRDWKTRRGQGVMLDTLGELERRKENYDGSLAYHRRAADVFAALVKEQSHVEPIVLSDLALSRVKEGDVLRLIAEASSKGSKGIRMQESVDAYASASPYLERAMSTVPSDFRNPLLLGHLLNKRTIALSALHKESEALKDLGRSRAVLDGLKDLRPPAITVELYKGIAFERVNVDYIQGLVLSGNPVKSVDAQKAFRDAMETAVVVLKGDVGEYPFEVLRLYCGCVNELAKAQLSAGGQRRLEDLREWLRHLAPVRHCRNRLRFLAILF